MRAVFAVLIFILSSDLAAADHWFEPAAPTSHSFVKLHARGLSNSGCVPRDAQVTKGTNVIEIRWTSPYGGCLTWPTAWQDEVAVGAIEPGVYEVRFHYGISEIFPRETLIVTDAASRISLQPATVPMDGGATIRVRRYDDGHGCGMVRDVMIGGISVPVTRSDSYPLVFTVTAPAHAAGAVDVTVTFDCGNEQDTITAKASLRFVDPAAAPDDSAFERVLVPVLYTGPGAYGSQWVTEGKLRSVTDPPRPLRWMPDVMKAECASGGCEGEVVDLAAFGNHPSGLLLFIPRHSGAVTANLNVRDVSRENVSWGAQLPLVREDDFLPNHPDRFGHEPTLRFEDIPFDPPNRALLRLYGVDGATSVLEVAVRGERGGDLVTLAGDCGRWVTPCNSATPAFAAIDLQQMFPHLIGRGRFSVEVIADYGPAQASSLRFWAFVSITNNDTQQVTVVTPASVVSD